LTTSNEAGERKPLLPEGLRRRRPVCVVTARRRCPASPSSPLLASSPATRATRPTGVLQQPASICTSAFQTCGGLLSFWFGSQATHPGGVAAAALSAVQPHRCRAVAPAPFLGRSDARVRADSQTVPVLRQAVLLLRARVRRAQLATDLSPAAEA